MCPHLFSVRFLLQSIMWTFCLFMEINDPEILENSSIFAEAVVWMCSVKKRSSRKFYKIHRKHLYWILFLIKLQAATLLKKNLQHRCFLVNFPKKKIENTFLTEHPRTTASVFAVLFSAKFN